MEMDDVPGALQARLGPAATVGLLRVLDASQQEAKEDVINTCTERFERRLVEQASHLRVQIAQVETTLRGDMASSRVEYITWSFLFWVGQVLTITGVFAVMLRLIR
jgi:hypothetical protein